jgi:hypothetical protein
MSTQARQTKFRWGRVGYNSWSALRKAREDGEGVTREVEPGVAYLFELEQGLPFPVWAKLSDRQYELDLGDDDPPQTLTLAELRSRLHDHGKHHGSEKELAQLDLGLAALLDAIDELHRRGYAAGLLRPDNVLIRLDSQGRYQGLILPDLGFVLFRGLLPEWLRSDSPDAPLWDTSAERMNERSFDRGRHHEFARLFAETSDSSKASALDTQSDLRTVARLIAWILGLTEARSRKIPLHDPTKGRVAKVWLVLNRVMAGEIKSPAEFREALATDPASQEFIERNAPVGHEVPPFWRRALVPSVAALALLGLAYFGWKIVNKTPSPISHPLCPGCTERSVLYPLLIEFEKEKGSIPAEMEVVRSMHSPELFGRSGPTEVEKNCLGIIDDIALSDLEKGGQALPKHIDEEGWTDLKAAEESGRLRDQFVSLHEWKQGHRPSNEDYPPWLRRLGGLGFLSAP